MLRRTPRPTRTDTLFPYTPRSRSRAARPRGEGRPGRAGCGGAGAARLRLVSFSGHNCAFVSIASPRRDPPMFSLQTIFGSGKQFFELRSEEHTSELQSLMRISYAVFCLKKKKTK